MKQKHKSQADSILADLPDAIYTDGGNIGANPSPLGGTWCFCWVVGKEMVKHDSGIVVPKDTGWDKVSNNVAELWAAMKALESVPDSWKGTLWTDSAVTFWRVTSGTGFAGVPVELRQRVLDRRRGRKYSVRICKGHPTLKDLARGKTIKGVPVSKFNQFCDIECNRLAAEFREGLK